MKCTHQKCHASDRIWVPSHVTRDGTELDKIKPHYYCDICGEIEYLGPDRARGIGYFSNILGDIKRCLDIEYKKGGSIKVTSALLRLIAIELTRIDDFSDSFSKPFDNQKKEFYHVVKKFIPSLTRDHVENFFDPNPARYDEESVNFFGKYYEDLEEEYAEELAAVDGEDDYCFY